MPNGASIPIPLASIREGTGRTVRHERTLHSPDNPGYAIVKSSLVLVAQHIASLAVPCLLPTAYCILSAVLLAACAGQIEPSGGPPDTTPPFIAHTVPDSNAVHVTEPRVELDFSEYVDRLSVQQSIFVSPYVGELTYDWSGKSVTITFGDTLRRKTTYVVNVGTDVKDINAGNRMAHGFSLAFSTGDSIDTGLIVGRVYDPEPGGIMLFAYKLEGINPDTLDPTHTKPDYIQQTGSDGAFALSHLSLGPYRVFAVRDEYRNLVYDRQTDEFGVWRSDIVLTPEHPAFHGMNVEMAKEDTTRPFLTSARNDGMRTIIVRASESCDTAAFAVARFRVVDTLSGKSLPLHSWYIDADHPADMGIITAAPMDSGRGYRVEGIGLRDLVGNLLDSLHGAIVFTTTAERDTLPPVVRTEFADSATSVHGDEPIVLTFSKHPRTQPIAMAVQLRDSTGTVVPCAFAWRGGLNAVLTPSRELLQAAWYTLSIVLDSVRDYSGNAYRDSTRVIHFRTFDYRVTGSLEGTAFADTTVHAPIILTAIGLDVNPQVKKYLHLAKPGPFTFDRLIEGRWTVNGFRDILGTGTYDYGQPFPFRPSAPFGVSMDTVKVRARWTVGGVRVEIK